MTLLSMPHSFFMKRLSPFIGVAGAMGWTIWSDIRKGKVYPAWMYVSTTVFLFVGLIYILRRDFRLMADSVEDTGDALVIRRWRTYVTVPLTDVSKVEWASYLGAFRVGVDKIGTGDFGPPSGGPRSDMTCNLNAVAQGQGRPKQFKTPLKRKVPDIEIRLQSLAARVANANGPAVG